MRKHGYPTTTCPTFVSPIESHDSRAFTLWKALGIKIHRVAETTLHGADCLAVQHTTFDANGGVMGIPEKTREKNHDL